MDDLTTLKIEQSRRERSVAHARFLENSASYHHFLDFEKSAFGSGSLSTRHKELTALAISIVTKCEPCMEWHVEHALLAGASESEIFETIDVAIEMGGGQALAYSRFAIRALDFYRNR